MRWWKSDVKIEINSKKIVKKGYLKVESQNDP